MLTHPPGKIHTIHTDNHVLVVHNDSLKQLEIRQIFQVAGPAPNFIEGI